MNARILIFISILTFFSVTSGVYLARRLLGHLPVAREIKIALWAILALAIVSHIAGPLTYRALSFRPTSGPLFWLAWFHYGSMGFLTYLLLATLLRDLGLGFSFLATKLFSQDTSPERRGALLAATSAGAFGIAAVASGFSIRDAVAGPKLFNTTIPLKNLSSEWNGLKIVQISDLHIGPTIGKEYAERVVELAMSENPDLIALTGDFVDGSVEQLRELISPIKKLKAKHGVYYITGNHEYYSGAREWCAEMKSYGFTVLLNENVQLGTGAQKLVIAGVTDASGGQFFPDHECSPKKAMNGAPENSVKILLAHQPKLYAEASAAGFDLQLSGHTHAGQFFPFNFVVKWVHKYSSGLYKHENMQIYVNQGTGYWGPPMRLGVPSEISVLTLKS